MAHTGMINTHPPYRKEGLQKQAIELLFQRHISLSDGCWDFQATQSPRLVATFFCQLSSVT